LGFLCWAVSVDAREYRGVVYGLGSSEPVKGVLVSLGHTRIRTWTDDEGRFVLDSSETGIRKTSGRTDHIRVYWNHRSAVINLINASTINKISIYDLNGRAVFQSELISGSKSIKVPLMARGVYLLRLRGINGTYYNFKVNTSMPSVNLALNKDFSLQKRSSSSPPVKLLFRHDDYFPFDYEVSDPEKSIAVTLEEDPRSVMFNPNKVHSFDFNISLEDSLLMEKEVMDELYRAAQLSFNGQNLGQVGLRYKGSDYSLMNCFDVATGERYNKEACRKISLKVKFNKFQDKLRLYEMKELNLHSMSNDGSKMHDMLAYKMFRDMGIYSPRTSYVKVSINGVYQGLFLAVEAVDGRFTKSRWPEAGDGNLYKEVWPVSDDPTYYFQNLKTNNDDQDSTKVARMVDFYNAVNTSTSETFTEKVSPFVDFNYWIRYLAVDRAIKNWDGITGWYTGDGYLLNHNFFLYEEEKAGGKVWIIPWDLDNTFQRSDPIIDDADVPNWNEKAQSCEPVPVFGATAQIMPPNCDKFTALMADNYWTEFVKTGNELLKKVYIPDNLIKRVDDCISVIDTVIEKDPTINHNVWKNEVNILKVNIKALHNRFYEYVNQIEDIIDTSDYSAPFTGNGKLVIDCTNNFEFTPQEEEYRYCNLFYSDGSDGKVVHSVENPIWGTADIRLSFIINPIEDQVFYSEWIKTTLKTKTMLDIRDCKEIRIHLSSDRQRYVWVGLGSYAAEDYGWAIYVNDYPKMYRFRMDEISYPSWDERGDPGKLDMLLKECTGISFSPSPAFDSWGELNGPDTGFLRIDNIKFVF
jgi:hypothetical protein